MPTKVAIRTSDRNSFRRCRVAWDYGSPLRHNAKRIAGIETRHLDFGSAIHVALEYYWNFELQQDLEAVLGTDQEPMVRVMLEAEAIAAFNKYMAGWKQQLIKNKRWHTQSEEEWTNWVNLGNSMLQRYFKWAQIEYTEYEVAYSEVEFEVPIPVPDEVVNRLRSSNSENIDIDRGSVLTSVEEYKEFWPALDDDTYYLLVWNEETKTWDLVLYQGRIDVIFRHRTSRRYWVVDHKTTARFDDLTDWIDLDPQGSSYFWAISKMLGIDVEGIIFSYLRKAIPEPPKVNKNGRLSVDKSQNTTLEMFRFALGQSGQFIDEKYQDFLNTFEEPTYFKSNKTYRSEDELNFIEYTIATEAIEMLDDPYIYPNPNQMNCRGCAYKQPCQLKHSGNDDVWFLQESGAYEYNAERAIK